MFKAVQVFRAKFKTNYGSSSTLIAVESLGDVEDAVNEYEDKTGGKFVKFEDECVMTPHLYVKEKS
jgi:hypothetical protein